MGPLLAIFNALLSKLFADEINAWLPWISDQLTQLAVKRLPQVHQERYLEEWRSHLGEVPGKIGKLAVAVGFVRAAFRSSVREFVIDIIGRTSAVLMLLVLAPLLVLVGLIVKVTSSGPVLCRKPMVGRGGHPFEGFRFRTMGSARVTGIGKVLRRSGCSGCVHA
jgi:hypothetical protein